MYKVSIGLYDFFSHFVPGLIFIIALKILVNFLSPINIEAINFILLFILSYISGRFMKMFFEIIMEFNIFRNFFYRVNDKDKPGKRFYKKNKNNNINEEEANKDITKKIFKGGVLDHFKRFEIIQESQKSNDHIIISYNYDNYNDENPYEKKMIIEQGATVLKQQEIEGDYIMYGHLKYFYQLMSIACFIIFCLYASANYLGTSFLLSWSEGILVIIILFIIFGKFFNFVLNSWYPYIKNLSLFLLSFSYTLYLFLYSSLDIKGLILLISLPCSLLFREMFIFTYKIYLKDVIRNYYVYENSKKNNKVIELNYDADRCNWSLHWD